MKTKIFLNMLLLIVVTYLFSMCSSNGNRTTYNDNNVTHADYNINHYIDTINGHIILTTVCDDIKIGGISVSTLELNNN